ncbi:hypothetical protein DHEL01_v210673 [Diaporthe helianthi]|uniref:Uncharacterized protein n=1 Tax=Diaporthe helianthi TaxID=158607 RepID=A0A2P5HL12_DIAHE|nr:hypothetical protein DHEL01_v210673 [Diaporthe helianthi]
MRPRSGGKPAASPRFFLDTLSTSSTRHFSSVGPPRAWRIVQIHDVGSEYGQGVLTLRRPPPPPTGLRSEKAHGAKVPLAVLELAGEHGRGHNEFVNLLARDAVLAAGGDSCLLRG